jgi:hypothetical protein
VKSWIRVRIKFKIESFLELKIDPLTLTLEIALKIKPWRVFSTRIDRWSQIPQHFEEVLDPDPHVSDPDPQPCA